MSAAWAQAGSWSQPAAAGPHLCQRWHRDSTRNAASHSGCRGDAVTAPTGTRETRRSDSTVSPARVGQVPPTRVAVVGTQSLCSGKQACKPVLPRPHSLSRCPPTRRGEAQAPRKARRGLHRAYAP